MQRLLVVTQISVSLLLVVGSLLFVRSFRNLMTFDRESAKDGITVAFLGFWQSDLPRESLGELPKELLDEIRSVPGVLSAANHDQRSALAR